jgi:hypothetical protein
MEKIIAKLAISYPTETTAILPKTSVFNDLNNLLVNEKNYLAVMMTFILKSNLNVFSNFSLAFLRLLVLAF